MSTEPKPTTPIEDLTVVVSIAQGNPVLIDKGFMATFLDIEARSHELVIKDDLAATTAGALIGKLTRTSTTLEAERDKCKRPYFEAGKLIDAEAKKLQNRILSAKTKLNTALVNYQLDKAAKEREAEERRQKELQALELKRQQEEAAAAKAAAEAAKNTPVPSGEEFELDFGDDLPAEPVKTETEKRIEELKFAPAVPEQKIEGVSWRVTLQIEAVDVNKLPDIYVNRSANESLIRETYCVGWKDGDPMPEVPGVKWRVARNAISKQNRF